MKKSGVRNKVKEMQYLKKNSQSKTPLAAVQKSINTNISWGIYEATNKPTFESLKAAFRACFD